MTIDIKLIRFKKIQKNFRRYPSDYFQNKKKRKVKKIERSANYSSEVSIRSSLSAEVTTRQINFESFLCPDSFRLTPASPPPPPALILPSSAFLFFEVVAGLPPPPTNTDDDDDDEEEAEAEAEDSAKSYWKIVSFSEGVSRGFSTA